jgi:hypothetical protein
MGVLGVVMQKYMVIERFKAGCWDAAHERFQRQGSIAPKWALLFEFLAK